MATNASLRSYSAEKLEELRTLLSGGNADRRLAPFSPSAEWVVEGRAAKFVDNASGIRPNLTTGIRSWVAFFNTETKKLSLITDMVPGELLEQALEPVVGASGSIVSAIEQILKPSGARKKGGMTVEQIKAELSRTSGKPNGVTQSLKPGRLNVDGDARTQFNISVYLADPSKKRDIALDVDGVPPEIAAANFTSGHPVLEMFKDNDLMPKMPRFSTVDIEGRPSGWEVLARGSFETRNAGFMWKGDANCTVGGLSIKYNETHKLAMLSMYLNSGGLEVIGFHRRNSDAEPTVDHAAMDVYSQVTGDTAGLVKRVYGTESPAKKRPAEEETAAPAAKRAAVIADSDEEE